MIRAFHHHLLICKSMSNHWTCRIDTGTYMRKPIESTEKIGMIIKTRLLNNSIYIFSVTREWRQQQHTHKRCIHHNTEWRWFRKPAGVPFSGRSGGRSVSLFSFLFSVIYWVGIGENCWCVERLIIEKRSSGISLPFSQSRERETLLVGRNVWLRAIHHQRRRARHHPANPARMRKAYFQIKRVCVCMGSWPVQSSSVIFTFALDEEKNKGARARVHLG